MPRTIPAFAELRLDPTDHLWVREYDLEDATAFFDQTFAFRRGQMGRREIRIDARRWHVFDATGQMLGEVHLPPRFQVHEIGDDWILGVWRSELDVEHVRMYRIEKPAR
jgi:hypothetical protein